MTKMTIYVKRFFQSLKPPVEVRCDIHPIVHEHVLIHTNTSHIFFKKWIISFYLEAHCHVLALCDSPQHHFKRSNVLPLCIPILYFDGEFFSNKLFKLGCTYNNVPNFSYHFDGLKLHLIVTFTFEGTS